MSITIYYYASRNNYIWFNSKISTINNILEDNYKNYKIYQSFDEYEHYSALNFSYYDLLKNATKDTCAENLKQCGILDTYGNKLCLYKDFPCPVNEIIVDLTAKRKNYTKEGFKRINYHLLRKVDGYSLYFRNTSYDKKIISSLIYFDSPPKLIDNHNFKFDLDAYGIKYGDLESSIKTNLTNYFNLSNYTNIFLNELNLENSFDSNNFTKVFEGDEDEYVNWNEIPEIKTKLLIKKKLEKYINSSLNKNNDEDKNYTKIFDKIYYKNFIGFENAEVMDKFRNVDFTIYKNIFPDNIKLLLIITLEVFLFIFIIIYILKLKIYDNDLEDICKKNEYYIIICGMSIYIFSFIFFFGFYVKSAIDIFKNNDFYELQNIKCDQIIIDFLNEFIKRYNIKKVFVILLIIFLFFSLILYILSIIYYVKKEIEDLKRNEEGTNSLKSEPNNNSKGNENKSSGTNSGNNIIININNKIDNVSNSQRNPINNNIENESILLNINNSKKGNNNNIEGNQINNEIINQEIPKITNVNKNKKGVKYHRLNTQLKENKNKNNNKDNVKRGNTYKKNLDNQIQSSERNINGKMPNKAKTILQKKTPFKDNCLLI